MTRRLIRVMMVIAVATAALGSAPAADCAPADGWRSAPAHGCCCASVAPSTTSCTLSCGSDHAPVVSWIAIGTAPHQLTHGVSAIHAEPWRVAVAPDPLGVRASGDAPAAPAKRYLLTRVLRL